MRPWPALPAPVCIILLLVLTTFAAVPMAHATIGPDVRFRLLDGPTRIDAGDVIDLRIAVETSSTAILSDVRAGGRGWLVHSQSLASMQGKEPGTEVLIRALVTDPSRPLVLEAELAGQVVQRELNLSPRALSWHRGESAPVQSAPTDPGAPRASGTRSIPGPTSSPQPATTAEDDPPENGETRDKAPRNVRVHGHWVYQRQNMSGSTTTLGADGATVRIYDNDLVGRQLLATGTTDEFGWYDETFLWDPCGTCENDPDIVIVFEAANDVVEVEEPILEFNYKWETGEWHNFTGTDLDVGPLMPFYETDHPALHLLTNIVRSWRWFQDAAGYSVPPTDVQWPASGTGAWYSYTFQEIHISPDVQWSEPVASHEYGHHWVKNFSQPISPDYCNGTCDAPLNCGHCWWCDETDHDALMEGFPNWLAQIITDRYLPDYGIASSQTWSWETMQWCSSGYDTPQLTEGFLAGVMLDIQDSSQDNDWYDLAASDELSMGHDEILSVMDFQDPTDPMDFLQKFLTSYPSMSSELWATARNNGYELDQTAPGVPTNVYSTTHAINVPDPDPTPQFLWDIPSDDVSGVAGFSVSITTTPQMPDTVIDIGSQNFYDAPMTAPGTYWFNIISVDRAGRWSSYATYGPFIVDQPDPVNLVPATGTSIWDFPLVPRDQPDATPSSVHVSNSLPGWVNDTYWNFRSYNFGTLTTGSGYEVGIYVDDALAMSVPLPPHPGTDWWNTLNEGPVYVRGGRHVLTGFVDRLDDLAETDETDNVFGHQWAWQPLAILQNDPPLVVTTPAAATAGWETVTDGSPLYYNSDGFRVSPVTDWQAVVVDPLAEQDLDLRAFTASSGTNGFAVPLVESARGPDCLDAVFFQPAGASNWDVGVVNPLGEPGSYGIRWIGSSLAFVGNSPQLDFVDGEMMKIVQVRVGSRDVGGISVVGIPHESAIFRIGWIHQAIQLTNLTALQDVVTISGTQSAATSLNATAEGDYAVVIWRDPKDGRKPKSLTLKIRPQLPDVTDMMPSGWHAPLVPRRLANATPIYAPAPTSLTGDASSTYVNVAMENLTATTTANFDSAIRVDGRTYLSLSAGVSGLATTVLNNQGPIRVPGGRHTFALHLDAVDSVEEENETNNAFAEQWVWSPTTLADAVPQTRDMPEDRIAGWENLTGPAWYNCDGLRMPLLGTFQAVAVMPGTTSNVDIRLHEASTGPTDGFAAPLAGSAWGEGQSDFIIVNQAATTPRDFDLGVIRSGAGTQQYSVEAVSAISLGNNPPLGDYGPYQLPGGRILNLHTMNLVADQRYGFEILPTGDDIDWGLTVHPAATAFVEKSDWIPQGAAWLEPAGVGEYVSVDIDASDWYCVAVWKVSTGDLPNDVSYTLRVTDITVVGAPTLPAEYTTHAPAPNPFNPRTTLRFELPREDRVRVVIYDTAGRLVRRLTDRSFPAGNHEVLWMGRDDRGRQVASGVYLSRVTLGGRERVHRMVLVK